MTNTSRKLDDVGTRAEHLMQLLETWEDVLEAANEIPTYRRFNYPSLERLLANLPCAIEELKATLQKASNFNTAFYEEGQATGNETLSWKGRQDRAVIMAAKWFDQPIAPNCPIDEHSHRRGEFCRGCSDLTGWLPPPAI